MEQEVQEGGETTIHSNIEKIYICGGTWLSGEYGS